jgi:hypothetical protein
MPSDKTSTRPDRVIACLKYGKQTHKKNATDMLDHLRNTRPVAHRDPSPEKRPKAVSNRLENTAQPDFDELEGRQEFIMLKCYFVI